MEICKNISSIENLDNIGIVFRIVLASLTLLSWVFNNFTDTSGGVEDVLLRRASFTKVSQIRKNFQLSRKETCKSFYTSKFLNSLVGAGYSCYFPPDRFTGPLEMDKIARFKEVI